MKLHPLAAFFPQMTNVEKIEFLEDVLKNGVRDPVVTLKGMILDGGHRYRAALKAGVDCPVEEYKGDDPAGFVISRNAFRRHMSSLERAKAVQRCRAWSSDPDSTFESISKAEIAQEAGTSESTVARARRELRAESDPMPVPLKVERRRRRTREPEAVRERTHAMVDGETPDEQPEPLSEIDELKVKCSASEARVRSLNDALEAEKERTAFLTQDQSVESARREEIFSSQREEIRVLKARVAELTNKLNAKTREAGAVKRELSRVVKERDKMREQYLEIHKRLEEE